HLRVAGVDVSVVSPASFRHFGLAYGSGIVGNLRRAPWKGALVPAFIAGGGLYARSACLVPPLRARVRVRDRREPPACALEGGARARLYRGVCARGAQGCDGRRPRPRALAAVRAGGPGDGGGP